MIPAFDIEGGWPLALARAVSVIGLAASAGGLVYAAFLRPPGLPAESGRRLVRLNYAALLLGEAGALVWLLIQTQDFTCALLPGDVWSVLSATQFGRLMMVRIVLLAVTAIAVRCGGAVLAAIAAMAALVLQAGHSHAMAMGAPAWLIAASAMHVLAAGIWLGALPAFWVTLRGAPGVLALAASRRFSLVGIGCVGVLLVTACAQFQLLVTDVPGLLGTAYGWVVCVKIVLFAVLIGLAVRNRYRITPVLAREEGAAWRLRRAVVAEIALGVVAVCAAGVLTELQPAMHVQKLWPFGWLFSLDAAREDPDIMREVVRAGVAALFGVFVLVSGLVAARRRRVLGAAAGLVGVSVLGVALPHFSPVVVPAEPTVFYRSPTGFTAGSINAGAALYGWQCAACHGPEGRGDGILAPTLPVPPADLTATHLWMHSDGTLFWWLTHGIEAPDGRLAMPGFARLDDEQRWDLIDFIRARNAGLTLAGAGVWGTPVQAPDFAVSCAGRVLRLSELRGGEVRLLLGVAQEVQHRPGVTDAVAGGHTPGGGCRALDQSVSGAYAVVAPGAKAVLIDANGWLRKAGPDAAGLGSIGEALPSVRAAMPMDMKM